MFMTSSEQTALLAAGNRRPQTQGPREAGERRALYRMVRGEAGSRKNCESNFMCDRFQKSRALSHYRCTHPGQQQGRRLPVASSLHARCSLCALVSAFLADVIQHTHSLRAKGVLSFHASTIVRDCTSAARTSGGILCNAVLARVGVAPVIRQILYHLVLRIVRLPLLHPHR